MSKFLTVILVAIIGIFSLTGCVQKKPDLPAYTMSATVGTSGFSTGACTATIGGSSLTILGKTGETPVFSLFLVNWSGGMGTTIISDPVATNAYISYASGGSAQFVMSGAITITSMSGTDITGTFYGTLMDGTVITDGKFIAEKL